MDNRYPHMHPIDGRRLPPALELNESWLVEHGISPEVKRSPGFGSDESARISRWAMSLANGSGVYPWWNQISQTVVFCPANDPSAGVADAEPVKATGILRFPHEDEIRRNIHAGRKSWWEKNREMYVAEQNAKSDREIAKEQKFEDMENEARSIAHHHSTRPVSVAMR